MSSCFLCPQIWSLSDPAGKGYLDKQGLFMALRLIAVGQAGKDPAISNMALSDPPPKIFGVEVPLTNKWTVEVRTPLGHNWII